MKISDIRAQQQAQQAKAIQSQRKQPPAIVATNPTRDPIDGTYKLTGTDGSVISQTYNSNSRLHIIPSLVVPSQTLGLPGFMTQRPR
jgi:hypothetical protein